MGQPVQLWVCRTGWLVHTRVRFTVGVLVIPVGCAVVAAAYLAGWFRTPAADRPAPVRTAWFLLGLLLLAASCAGPVGSRAAQSYTWWLSQGLLLLLVVPIPLVAGQPGLLLPKLRLPAVRLPLAPVWSALAVPLIAAVAFFGPVPGWAAASSVGAIAIQLALLLIGLLIALPLVRPDRGISSLTIGVALVIGVVELLLDAVPGIVLRLSTHQATGWFTGAHRPFALADQQRAGAVLWTVAEVLDLPFIVLLFVRWLRADEREAATEDVVLAEQIARTPADQPDRPWFLDDPRLRDRFQ